MIVRCDYCGDPIPRLDDGIVEWRYLGEADHTFHSIRLVHGNGTGPAGRRGCTFHEQGKTGQLLDLNAYVFAWPGRHARYLRALGCRQGCLGVVQNILVRCKMLRLMEPPDSRREHRARFRLMNESVPC